MRSETPNSTASSTATAAVKAYERDVYPTTVAGFPKRGRSARYRKVFRLDGSIHTDEWTSITSLWFRGNRLILEYLQHIATASSLHPRSDEECT